MLIHPAELKFDRHTAKITRIESLSTADAELHRIDITNDALSYTVFTRGEFNAISLVERLPSPTVDFSGSEGWAIFERFINSPEEVMATGQASFDDWKIYVTKAGANTATSGLVFRPEAMRVDADVSRRWLPDFVLGLVDDTLSWGPFAGSSETSIKTIYAADINAPIEFVDGRSAHWIEFVRNIIQIAEGSIHTKADVLRSIGYESMSHFASSQLDDIEIMPAIEFADLPQMRISLHPELAALWMTTDDDRLLDVIKTEILNEAVDKLDLTEDLQMDFVSEPAGDAPDLTASPSI